MELTGLGKIDVARAPRPPGQAPSSTRILDASVKADRDEWLDLWQDWPDREVMAHPDYVRLFARPTDLTLAATLRTSSGGILYPFILRPLVVEPWVPAGVVGFDITSAYGYGGPFAWDSDGEDARIFWHQMDRWAKEREVVTSFARLSIVPEQLLPFPGEVRAGGPVIIRGLDGSPAEIWADYAPKVRQNVRRAQSRGCTVVVDPAGQHLDEFLAIYTSTMERRGATSGYYFPREFFESLVGGLKTQCLFFHVVLAGKIVSTMLVLLSRNRAYFFLGGTLEEAFDARPSDYLMHEVILWCRAAGLKSFVLGGGNPGSPGLLRYKTSFAPTGERPFQLARKIHDGPLAERLAAERVRWERTRGTEWKPDPGYFPPYRALHCPEPGLVINKENEPCPRS